MTAVVFSADRTERKMVKNLGWLRRHWKEVESFEVSKSDHSFPQNIQFQAHLNDGRMYQCFWGSTEALWNFLSRPVFKGALLTWFGEKTVCGSPSFNWKDFEK